MSAPSFPAGHTTRQTAAIPQMPPWVLLVLGVLGVALAFSALIQDYYAMMGAALAVLAIGGAVVLYRPYVGVLVIMSTMLMSYPDALKGSPPFTINTMLGAALLTILIFQCYRSHDYWFLREPEVRLLIGIAIWFIITQTLSELYLPEKRMLPVVIRRGNFGREYGQSDDSTRWVFELVSRVAFMIFFVNWVKTAKQMRWVLYMLAACVAIVIPTVGPDIAGSETEYRITSKVAGWATNANRFAFMLNVGIALFIYLANVLKPIPVRLLLLGLAAAGVPIVLMSASRSGFIGLGIIGVLLLYGRQIPRQTKVMAGALGLVLAVLAFNFVLTEAHQERLLNLNPFANTEGTNVNQEGTRSTQTRVATIGEAFNIILKYPLTGVGLANFRWVNAVMHGSYKPPHNSYIWSAAEGGLPATVMYLTLFGFLYTRIQRLREKYDEHPSVPHLPEFLHLYLLLLFFFSIFADVWLEVHLYFICAIAIVLSRWVEDEELMGVGLPGSVAGTPGAKRAAARGMYRQES